MGSSSVSMVLVSKSRRKYQTSNSNLKSKKESFKCVQYIIFYYFMLFIGCQNNPTDPGVSLNKTNKIQSMQTLDCQKCDLEDIKAMLEEMAQFISQNSTNISNKVRNQLLQETVIFSELFPQSNFPTSVTDAEGTPYEVGIE